MASAIAVIAPLFNGVLLLLAVFTAVNPKDCNEPDKVARDILDDLCVSEGDKTPIGSYFGKSKLSVFVTIVSLGTRTGHCCWSCNCISG